MNALLGNVIEGSYGIVTEQWAHCPMYIEANTMASAFERIKSFIAS